jgi:hypothetical protein
MEQREATKKEVVDLLWQWENEQVRVHASSHGVGVNYWGYLDLAYDSSRLSPYGSAGEPPPPHFVLLCRTKRKEGVLRTDIPIVAIDLDDFKSFGIIEDNANQLVFMEKEEARIRVLIERGQYESA